MRSPRKPTTRRRRDADRVSLAKRGKVRSRGAAGTSGAGSGERAARRRIAALQAQVKSLEARLERERRSARERMARAQREFETRLTLMVQEIGQLRHHEARVRVLERQLATREAGSTKARGASQSTT